MNKLFFSSLWKRYGLFTSVLALYSLFAIGWVGLRIHLSHQLSFVFLIWNLFLAWIPLLISFAASYLHHLRAKRYFLVILSVLWLLFFPNAPYITTDFLHLRMQAPIPLWFDLLLIFSFAWAGLLLGFRSLLEMHQLYTKWLGKAWGWALVFSSMGLSAFGIYLGRYLRWNSWDLLTHPQSLLADIMYRVTHLNVHPRTLGMTLAYSVFLCLTYLSLYFFQEKGESIDM